MGLMSLSLCLFFGSLYQQPKQRHDAFLQRFRCEVGEDGVPHFQEITGDNSKDGAFFPFSVRVFRIWLPNLFETGNITETDNDDISNDLLKSDDFFGGKGVDDDLETSDSDRSNLFREELSFNNHDTEQILTVDFLDFKNGRSGRFIHALSSNQTAIVDKNHNRCFVMPLDPDTNIIPEDILNMSSDKDLNTERVRKNMEIVTPKMEDLTELSPRIRQQCDGMNIYKLEKHNSDLFKRDTAPVARFSEIAGNKWIEHNIIGLDRLDQVE
ncbi:ITM2B family protein [Megaselia abdita]